MKFREILEGLEEEKKIQNWNSASVGKFRPIGINSTVVFRITCLFPERAKLTLNKSHMPLLNDCIAIESVECLNRRNPQKERRMATSSSVSKRILGKTISAELCRSYELVTIHAVLLCKLQRVHPWIIRDHPSNIRHNWGDTQRMFLLTGERNHRCRLRACQWVWKVGDRIKGMCVQPDVHSPCAQSFSRGTWDFLRVGFALSGKRRVILNATVI